MTEPLTIQIEVACATPAKQLIVTLLVANGLAIREAVKLSAIQHEFPQLDIAAAALGVFGREVADSYQLREGDRVEIYRPLINDPREARRALAAQGKTMGGVVPAADDGQKPVN